MENSNHDPVNHPKHYNSHPSGIECIEIVRSFSFNMGNAFKYLWRAGLKDEKAQDIKKAIWYLKDEVRYGQGNVYEENHPHNIQFSEIEKYFSENIRAALWLIWKYSMGTATNIELLEAVRFLEDELYDADQSA